MYGSRTTINTIATNQDRAIEFPVVFEPRERHLGYIDSTFLRPGSASVLSEHRMDAIRTTVKTIDTNRDTATEFPRQQPSSLTHESPPTEIEQQNSQHRAAMMTIFSSQFRLVPRRSPRCSSHAMLPTCQRLCLLQPPHHCHCPPLL